MITIVQRCISVYSLYLIHYKAHEISFILKPLFSSGKIPGTVMDLCLDSSFVFTPFCHLLFVLLCSSVLC